MDLESARAYKIYQECSPLRRYLIDPAILRVCADVRGRRIIDLGCGNGHLTRMLADLGATHVIGIDRSPAQIQLARAHELGKERNITYYCTDVRTFDPTTIDPCDLALMIFLLNHAETKGQLLQFLQSAAGCLKRKGRLVAVIDHPDHPLGEGVFGRAFSPQGKANETLQSGDILCIELWYQGKKLSSCTSYHWSRADIEEALKGAGFGHLRWHAMRPTREGLRQCPSHVWRECRPKTIGFTRFEAERV